MAKGLHVRAKLDKRKYPTGQKVSNAEMNKLAYHSKAATAAQGVRLVEVARSRRAGSDEQRVVRPRQPEATCDLAQFP